MTIHNAKITGTQLGKEDHGIMTAYVHCDFGGSGQGFGGYFLGGDRTDTFIQGVLDATGVRRWEKLPGAVVRVKREDGLLRAIGHFLDDRWFTPADALKGT